MTDNVNAKQTEALERQAAAQERIADALEGRCWDWDNDEVPPHALYQGNSVDWTHSKSKKYGDALLEAWRALRDAGIEQDEDGSKRVVDGIRELAARNKEGK